MLLEINKNEITKESINSAIQKIVSAVENGDISGLHALAWYKSIEKILAGVKNAITESAIDDFGSYPEKYVMMYGFEFTQKESGVRYDFSNTEKWQEIKEEENKVAEKRKEVEKLLKTIKTITDIIDDDTGEVFTLYPPIKSSTTVIQATQK